jgi:hypothetical protein
MIYNPFLKADGTGETTASAQNADSRQFSQIVGFTRNLCAEY